MQISPINQNNQNFKAAYMSWRTASKVGFSKRTLLKKFPNLKNLADTRELLIKPSNETYEMIKWPSSKDIDKIECTCAIVGVASIFAVFYSPVITLLGVFGSLGVAVAAASGSREPDKKECHKMIIQVGDHYKNGKLEGNTSQIVATYEALNQHSDLPLQTNVLDEKLVSSNRKNLSDIISQLNRKERISEEQIKFLEELETSGSSYAENMKNNALVMLNSPVFYLAKFELMDLRNYLFPDERKLSMHELPYSLDNSYKDEDWHIKRDNEDSSNISGSFWGERRYTIAGGVLIPKRKYWD